FSTNNCVQAAALAALRAETEMRRRADIMIAERDRITAALRAHVPDLPGRQSNFVWLPIGADTVPFAEHCEARGVIVRPFPGEGVRASFGTPEQNDRFLSVAGEFFA